MPKPRARIPEDLRARKTMPLEAVEAVCANREQQKRLQTLLDDLPNKKTKFEEEITRLKGEEQKILDSHPVPPPPPPPAEMASAPAPSVAAKE